MSSDRVMPRYPVYIPTKGRGARCLTARALVKDGVPFKLVMEPHQVPFYAPEFGEENILLLPFDDPGVNHLYDSRNWIKEHSRAAGDERHWQLDDNITCFFRRYRARRLYCEAGIALRVCEDFTDRYENIAISGLNYGMFVPEENDVPPYHLNCRVYSCTLVLNSTPYRWRVVYNDDTDMCLQVLADGWCTVLINVFLAQKLKTMTVKGGNTTTIYQGDGRVKMARSLERLWPGVVTTRRRFRRPQHVVKDAWRRFDTPLKLKPGIDLSTMKAEEYGMRLAVKKPPRSIMIRKLAEEYGGS
jgi:hypothetical protein